MGNVTFNFYINDGTATCEEHSTEPSRSAHEEHGAPAPTKTEVIFHGLCFVMTRATGPFDIFFPLGKADACALTAMQHSPTLLVLASTIRSFTIRPLLVTVNHQAYAVWPLEGQRVSFVGAPASVPSIDPSAVLMALNGPGSFHPSASSRHTHDLHAEMPSVSVGGGTLSGSNRKTIELTVNGTPGTHTVDHALVWTPANDLGTIVTHSLAGAETNRIVLNGKTSAVFSNMAIPAHPGHMSFYYSLLDSSVSCDDRARATVLTRGIEVHDCAPPVTGSGNP